ncbi:DNA ligase 1-like isoform X2 [Oscarella lobularis]
MDILTIQRALTKSLLRETDAWIADHFAQLNSMRFGIKIDKLEKANDALKTELKEVKTNFSQKMHSVAKAFDAEKKTLRRRESLEMLEKRLSSEKRRWDKEQERLLTTISAEKRRADEAESKIERICTRSQSRKSQGTTIGPDDAEKIEDLTENVAGLGKSTKKKAETKEKRETRKREKPKKKAGQENDPEEAVSQQKAGLGKKKPEKQEKSQEKKSDSIPAKRGRGRPKKTDTIHLEKEDIHQPRQRKQQSRLTKRDNDVGSSNREKDDVPKTNEATKTQKKGRKRRAKNEISQDDDDEDILEKKDEPPPKRKKENKKVVSRKRVETNDDNALENPEPKLQKTNENSYDGSKESMKKTKPLTESNQLKSRVGTRSLFTKAGKQTFEVMKDAAPRSSTSNFSMTTSMRSMQSFRHPAISEFMRKFKPPKLKALPSQKS